MTQNATPKQRSKIRQPRPQEANGTTHKRPTRGKLQGGAIKPIPPGIRTAEMIEKVRANNCSHLDPVIRPIAAQKDLSRARHILKDLYLSHPPAQHVERQIEQLIWLPRRIRMPGLFLCGDSGMGKTHVLRRVERRHPEADDPLTKRHIRPVLYVQVPAGPDFRTLRQTVIEELNIPFSKHPSRPSQESILRRALAAARTELIVLDEIHNIVHTDGKQRTWLLDWVRCLSNETQRPVVLAGTEEFESVILSYPQLASLYPTVRLARWTAGPDLAAFLQGYERACPLRLASHLSEISLVRALLDETDGVTDTIIRCLQAAALVAIREGTERIVPEYLSWWRDPPLLAHYETADDEQKSVALAKAWLKDERRAAPSPSARAGLRWRNRASLSTGSRPWNG